MSAAAGSTPKLREIDGVRLVNSGWATPERGQRGGFANAFSVPPYGLQAGPLEVQALFDAVLHFILPDRCGRTILDWTSRRLTVVAGSTTD
jgi:hypothetical protein